MIIPDEFERFASGFYQGSRQEFSTGEEWIASALDSLNVEQKNVLKQFLTELTAGNHDDAELQRIWNGTSADYYFSGDDGLRGFFAMIRDLIERS
ncbi:MAG: hypothetical protein HY659_14775 [Rhizobiales bacterium]|nr:hypothetical protein [Hyphomicrobiales bacterium]